MTEYRGFTPEWAWDAEMGEYFGRVAGIRDVVTFQGATPEALAASFRASVDLYLDGFAGERLPPPSSFHGGLDLPLTPELHRAAWEACGRDSDRLAAWIADLVAREMARDAAPSRRRAAG